MMNQGPKKTETAEGSAETESIALSPPRKTLAGRVIGYTGMDPPPAFESILEGNSDTESDSEGEGEGSMSRADIEMIEYERIKSMRRKRGTLKKNHKPQAQPQEQEQEQEQEGIEERDVEIWYLSTIQCLLS